MNIEPVLPTKADLRPGDHEEIRRHAARMEALAEISQVLTRVDLDVQAVFSTIVKCSAEVIGDMCAIRLLSSDGQWLNPIAFHHANPAIKTVMAPLYETTPIAAANEWFAGVLQTGQPLLIPNVSQEQLGQNIEPEYMPYVDQIGIHSVLIIPLQKQGRVIGTLAVTRDTPGRPYTSNDQIFLIELANRAALSLQNAELFGAERYQREVAETLRDLVVAVNSTLDIDQVLNLTVQRLKVLHQASACSMSFLAEDGQTFFFRATTDPDLDLFQPLTFPADRSIAGRAIRERQVQIVNDVDQAPDYQAEIARRTRIIGRSLLTAPLFANDKPLGVIQVLKPSPDAFSQADAQLLATTAALIETALGRTQAYTQAVRLAEAEHHQREVAETLRQAGAIITSSLHQDEIIEPILEQLARVVPYDSATVQLLGDGYLETVGGRGWSNPEVVRGLRYPVPGPNPNTVVIQERRPHILSEVRLTSSNFNAEYYNHIQSWLGVPLIAQDRVIGMLTLDSSQLDYFTPDHAQLAAAFADHVAIALENARLFEAEHQAHQLAETLRAANLALTRTLDLETVLETLLDYLGQLVPYDSACVMLLETEDHLVVRASRGYERWAKVQLSRYSTLDISTHPNLDALLTSQVGILIPDTHDYPGWDYDIGANHVRNWLGIPLVAGGKTIGLYSVDKVDPGFFTQEHLRSAEALAAQAAVTIQNALLFSQLNTGRQRLQALSHRLVEVQEAERRYLARELHDEVGEILTGLKLILEMSKRLPMEAAQDKVNQAQGLVNDLMRRVEEMSLDLRPAMLDDLGLLPALLWHFERYTGLTQVSVSFEHTGLERRFRPEVETAAYRIIQEALTNVARHAHVSEVMVRLWADENILSLQIEDQGPGFKAEAALAAYVSSGLAGMYERAVLAGGQLTIDSTPHMGTHLMAELPLEAN